MRSYFRETSTRSAHHRPQSNSNELLIEKEILLMHTHTHKSLISVNHIVGRRWWFREHNVSDEHMSRRRTNRTKVFGMRRVSANGMDTVLRMNVYQQCKCNTVPTTDVSSQSHRCYRTSPMNQLSWSQVRERRGGGSRHIIGVQLTRCVVRTISWNNEENISINATNLCECVV